MIEGFGESKCEADELVIGSAEEFVALWIVLTALLYCHTDDVRQELDSAATLVEYVEAAPKG